MPRKRATTKHHFTLVLGPLGWAADEAEDALFEAGCDDALLSFCGDTPLLDFTREGSSLSRALLGAVKDVERAGIGARVLRVGPDDLVNAAELAARAGVSREAARLWIAGERATGFPPPVARVGKSMVWSWLEVAGWLHRRGRLDDGALDGARFIAALNFYLGKRRTPSLSRQLAAIERQLGAAEAGVTETGLTEPDVTETGVTETGVDA